MPNDNWGTPGRDTFKLESHEHFLAFLASNDTPFAPPYLPVQSKLPQRLQPPRVRTWKKLFEKMGVLYVSNQRLYLTDFGLVLKDQLTKPPPPSPENNPVIVDAALFVLAKYQLKNPTSRLKYPDNCDVFPYWTIWKIMHALGNKIHWEELNRVVLRIMKMEEIGAAVEKIRAARRKPGYPDSLSDSDFTRYLGQKVDLPQRSRAMSAIFSEAGCGGCIIEQKQRSDHFRHLNDTHLPLIDKILGSQPKYKKFDNKTSWFEHYGKISKPPFKPLPKTIENEIASLSQEVRESIIEAFLIEGKNEKDIQKILPTSENGKDLKVIKVLHYFGLEKSLKGIFKKLPTAPLAVGILDKNAPWLTPDQKNELISVLESHRASREFEVLIPEGYFSGDTEVKSTSSRRVRRQQNKLREILLKLYGNRCAICDIDDPALLITSHIIPWNVDKENRLNPENAIILCVLHDKLFENGLISFDDRLRLLVSADLSQTKSKFLNNAFTMANPFNTPKEYKPGKRFLEYHRKLKFELRN